MTASILLSLLLNINPVSQAHTQMSLEGFPAPPTLVDCDSMFYYAAANDSVVASEEDVNAVTAFGKKTASIFRKNHIEVYDVSNDGQFTLRHHFYPETEFEIHEMEFSKDDKYLIAHLGDQSLVFNVEDQLGLVYRDNQSEAHFHHYDKEHELLVIQAGEFIKIVNLPKKEVELAVMVRAGNSLTRSLGNNKKKFLHMLYVPGNTQRGPRILIEKNETERMLGVLDANFAEVRWYKEDKVFDLLGIEDTPDNRSAFFMRTVVKGYLESVRFLLQYPLAPIAP